MNIKKMIGVQKLMHRGSTEHERRVAREIFQNLLNKEGITEADFNSIIEAKEIYFFEYINKYERKLLFNVVSKAVNSTDFDVYVKKRKKKVRGFELTRGQYIDIKEMYEAYKNALDKEIEILISAFIIRNDIFAENPKNLEVLNSDESKYYQRVSAMVKNIEFVEYRKRIK